MPPILRRSTQPTTSSLGRAGGSPAWRWGHFPSNSPSSDDPGDTGWHVDMSFDWEKPDFMDWRVNVSSKGRALLMLFLFSDVGEKDAPTRIRVGTHLDIARMLAPAGETGLTTRELIARIPETEGCPRCSRPGRQALSISAIHSLCMRRSHTAARHPDSWRSHPCFYERRCNSTGLTTPTLRSSGYSYGPHHVLTPVAPGATGCGGGREGLKIEDTARDGRSPASPNC